MTIHEHDFASRLEIPVLQSEFDYLKGQFSSFYECARELKPLQLAAIHSVEADFTQTEGGIIYVGLENLENLQTELSYVHPSIGIEETMRLVLGTALAGGVAGASLAEFASEVKHEQYTEALRDFFASHKPMEALTRDLFKDDPTGKRARMADTLTDARATAINGYRYRFKLANDLFEAVSSHGENPMPHSTTLAMGARQRIHNLYTANSKIYLDVSVHGLDQSALLGDKLFFLNMPEWLLALAQPLQDADLAVIHSESWQRD